MNKKVINILGKMVLWFFRIAAITIALFLIVYSLYILVGNPCGLRAKLFTWIVDFSANLR